MPLIIGDIVDYMIIISLVCLTNKTCILQRGWRCYIGFVEVVGYSSWHWWTVLIGPLDCISPSTWHHRGGERSVWVQRQEPDHAMGTNRTGNYSILTWVFLPVDLFSRLLSKRGQGFFLLHIDLCYFSDSWLCQQTMVWTCQPVSIGPRKAHSNNSSLHFCTLKLLYYFSVTICSAGNCSFSNWKKHTTQWVICF